MQDTPHVIYIRAFYRLLLKEVRRLIFDSMTQFLGTIFVATLDDNHFLILNDEFGVRARLRHADSDLTEAAADITDNTTRRQRLEGRICVLGEVAHHGGSFHAKAEAFSTRGVGITVDVIEEWFIGFLVLKAYH